MIIPLRSATTLAAKPQHKSYDWECRLIQCRHWLAATCVARKSHCMISPQPGFKYGPFVDYLNVFTDWHS